MTTISTTAIFDSTLKMVDETIGDFVHKAYTNLVQGNETTITLAFTFYIVLLGYRFLTHSASSDLATLTRHGVVMLVVYGLIMQWSLYNTFFYNVFTGEPTYISVVLADSAGAPTTETSAQALDNIYNTGVRAAGELFSQIELTSPQYAFYALIVWFVTFVSCVFALCLLIYAKLALSIGLALGPIFLIFILWEGTKGLFESWIKKLVNFGLVPIITTCILMLMLSIENTTLGQLTTKDAKGVVTFEAMGPYLCVSIANFLLLMQVLPIAASLSGGIALASITKGIDVAKNALKAASSPFSGSFKAGKGTYKGYKWAKNRFGGKGK